MPRRAWRSHQNADDHVCGRCRSRGHPKRDCCHRLLWVDLPLDGAADLFTVGGWFTNDAGDRDEWRPAPTVKLPLVWVNYFVTAEVFSYVTWADVVRGDWLRLNRSAAAAIEPLLALRFRSGAAIFEGPAVVPRPIVPFSDGTLFALPPRTALRIHAKHSTLSASSPSWATASMVAGDDDGVVVGYLPVQGSTGGVFSRRDQLADRGGAVLVQGARSVGFTQRLVRVVDDDDDDADAGASPPMTAANTRLVVTHVRRAGRDCAFRGGPGAAPITSIVTAYVGVFRSAGSDAARAILEAILRGATVPEAEADTPPIVRL